MNEVTPIYEKNGLDIPLMLRTLADQIDSGTHEKVIRAVFVMQTADNADLAVWGAIDRLAAVGLLTSAATALSIEIRV